MELPEEALVAGETPQDVVEKLKASLYGTRDASTNWQEEVATCIVKWGFDICKYNPCLFDHLGLKMLCLVHGDDLRLCCRRQRPDVVERPAERQIRN